MPDSDAAISVAGLHKAFGSKVVLDGIDLHVPAGSIFSLLGSNGAGKTTTVQILSTLVPFDSGTINIAGHDLARDPNGVRRSIGVTGQFSAVDNMLTGEENLILMADLNRLSKRAGRQRAQQLLEQFDLVDAAKKLPAFYSGGMRRRLDLAMGLVGRPQIIFLDEPTTGLDPRSRRGMWETIRRLVTDDGVTVFLTTQYLEEADELADRIAVLDQGKLVAEGTADELKQLVAGGHIRLQFADQYRLDEAARCLPQGARDQEALALKVPTDGSVRALKSVLDRLEEQAIEVASVTVHTPDLDDVFLTLTSAAPAQKETLR
ncbi:MULTISPECIES: ATP-binding cassette domain-containing protein [Streptomyces]|uniref:ABC-type xenobiotic transporter n=1 Tax=Streptomyces alboflavus TaxID=67267 RepID=A0A1Z1WKR9_9ACTN|nr:ATP-binding cassette domain-containing protein [Streptomyces alboflavus]ARX87033.1 ABC transporter [Streptomyces alboflavus]